MPFLITLKALLNKLVKNSVSYTLPQRIVLLISPIYSWYKNSKNIKKKQENNKINDWMQILDTIQVHKDVNIDIF